MRQLMHSFVGSHPPSEVLKAVRDGHIAAFCLFAAKNVESPSQLRELTGALLRAAQDGNQPAPLIGIDQEGGQLIAIRGGATELPGNMALGATRSPKLAEQAGQVLGRELLAMGVNLNFAPSLDVNVNPANPVIGVRSFGDDPVLVAELGTAFIRGIQGEGVLATAKHFPGHGDTANDTHHALPIVDHALERMDAVELKPFRAAIAAGVAGMMTAHVLFPALDPDFPATLSSKVLLDFLRGTLGFGGLIITDAMDMHAVSQFGAEASVQSALNAGADLALLGHLPDQLALAERFSSRDQAGALARIRVAQDRVGTLQPSLDVVGSAEHQAIAQAIADQSITLVRDRDRLPLRPAPDDLIVVVTPEPTDLTPADTSSQITIGLADAIRRRHGHVLDFVLPRDASDTDLNAILEAAAQAAIVIVGTISAEGDAGQRALVQASQARGQQPIVIALRTPYDVMHFPTISTYLCAYGIRPVTMEAIAKVLFGEIEARGVLPCVIPGLLVSPS